MNRVHLDKLSVVQLFKKFPDFYKTGRFITMFTGACYLSLSWIRWILYTCCLF